MRHFLFAFCWLLISVSDSADVGEILGHWVGCAAFFFSHFVFFPVPISSSFPASPSASCQSSLLALPAVCLGVRFVSAQEMSLGSWTPTCSWLFAGIQSLSLPSLDQLPNPTCFLQGWRGIERIYSRLAEKIEAGYETGLGKRVPMHWPQVETIETNECKLGQRSQALRIDKCMETWGIGSSLPPPPLLFFHQQGLQKRSYVLHSLHREGFCLLASGTKLADCIQVGAIWFPGSYLVL